MMNYNDYLAWNYAILEDPGDTDDGDYGVNDDGDVVPTDDL